MALALTSDALSQGSRARTHGVPQEGRLYETGRTGVGSTSSVSSSIVRARSRTRARDSFGSETSSCTPTIMRSPMAKSSSASGRSGRTTGQHHVDLVGLRVSLDVLRPIHLCGAEESGRASLDDNVGLALEAVGIRQRSLTVDEWQPGPSPIGVEPGDIGHASVEQVYVSNADEFVDVLKTLVVAVEACIAAGLVGGEGFAVDASLIAADANKQRSIPGKDCRHRRAALTQRFRLLTGALATSHSPACRPRAV